MLTRSIPTTCLLAAALCVLAPLAFCQEAGASAQQQPEARTVYDIDDLVLTYYTPPTGLSSALQALVERVHGRSLYILQKGGLQGRATSNLMDLGRTLAVLDTPEQVERILSTIREFEKKHAAQHPRAEDPAEVDLDVFEYTPQHVGLDSLIDALESFYRDIPTGLVYGEPGAVANITRVRERGLLVVRETPEQLAQIRALVERLDVPEPQVVLTCQVLRAVREGSGSPDLSEVLVANLSRLVPYDRFELLTMGLVRTSVSGGREIAIRMEDPDTGYQCALELVPQAYAQDQQALSLARCEFESRTDRIEFTTSTVVRAGEYTVLGAAGGLPTFVVLQLTPVR